MAELFKTAEPLTLHFYSHCSEWDCYVRGCEFDSGLPQNFAETDHEIFLQLFSPPSDDSRGNVVSYK